MKQGESPHQRLEKFIRANRGVCGRPRLFALATGMDEDTTEIVLLDLAEGENPLVIEAPDGVWAYNPEYRPVRPTKVSATEPLPATAAL